MSNSSRLAVVAAILALPLLGYGVLAGEDGLIHFFPDDAFYYLQPAVHFARTGTASFDGLHPTNGFQPLQFLITAAEARLVSKPALLATTFLTDAVLLVSAVWLAVVMFGPRSPWASCALLAVLLSPPVVGPIVLSSGMEAALVVLATVLLAMAFDAAWRAQLQSRRKNLLLGAAMSAFLFARLDNVIAVAPCVLLLLAAPAPRLARPIVPSTLLDKPAVARLRLRLGRLLEIFWLPALLGLTYLAVNYLTTGHLVPISGYVKHTNQIPLRLSWHAATGGGLTGMLLGVGPLALSIAVLAFWGLSRFSRRGWSDVANRRCRRENGTVPLASRWAIVAINAGNVLFYVYLLFFASKFFRWYLAMPIACSIVNVVFLAAWCEPLLPRWAALGRSAAGAAAGLLIAASALANVAFLQWAGSRANGTSYQLRQVAELVSRHGGPAAVTGTYDAGVVGYFAAGTVINLDGLANSFDYYEHYARPGRLLEYFQETGMTHFLVRDGLLENAEQVGRGEYQTAVFLPDRRIVLRRDRELFRYRLPGSFAVYYFALEPGAALLPESVNRS